MASQFEFFVVRTESGTLYELQYEQYAGEAKFTLSFKDRKTEKYKTFNVEGVATTQNKREQAGLPNKVEQFLGKHIIVTLPNTIMRTSKVQMIYRLWKTE